MHFYSKTPPDGLILKTFYPQYAQNKIPARHKKVPNRNPKSMIGSLIEIL